MISKIAFPSFFLWSRIKDKPERPPIHISDSATTAPSFRSALWAKLTPLRVAGSIVATGMLAGASAFEGGEVGHFVGEAVLGTAIGALAGTVLGVVGSISALLLTTLAERRHVRELETRVRHVEENQVDKGRFNSTIHAVEAVEEELFTVEEELEKLKSENGLNHFPQLDRFEDNAIFPIWEYTISPFDPPGRRSA